MTSAMDTNMKRKLLIICQDVIDAHMAGPGLRYCEMARHLSDILDVCLVAPAGSDPKISGVRFFTYGKDVDCLKAEARSSDFIIISGDMPRQFPFLLRCRAKLIVDLYDPILFENLYYFTEEKRSTRTWRIAHDLDNLDILAQIGDHFICGSERQRDLWLGLLIANRRVDSAGFPTGKDSLVDVVGMGLPDRAPSGESWLKGYHPQVPADARIVLWGGGIWNWLDPLTLIQAWPTVTRQLPNARLVFLGTRHPNPAVPQHVMAQKALDLANEIGELDKTILFFEWLSTRDREALLCEADVGVVYSPDSIETHFALRTRVLDYFWAKLPVVTNFGDVLSEVVRQHELGWVVPPGNQAALTTALIAALTCDRSKIAHRYIPVLDEYRWENQLRPLKTYFVTQPGQPVGIKRKKPRQMRFLYRLQRRLCHLIHSMTVKD